MGSARGESGDDSSPLAGRLFAGSPFTGSLLADGCEGSPGPDAVGRPGAGTACIQPGDQGPGDQGPGDQGPGDQGPGDQGPGDGVGGAGDGSAAGEPAICEGKYDLGISGVS